MIKTLYYQKLIDKILVYVFSVNLRQFTHIGFSTHTKMSVTRTEQSPYIMYKLHLKNKKIPKQRFIPISDV